MLEDEQCSASELCLAHLACSGRRSERRSGKQVQYLHLVSLFTTGQFRGDGRTVRTLVFGVYKICCITGSYLWVIQKDITL